MKEIGFIGLGNMGSKMALHLANAGHRVYGYDINEHLVEELSVLGVLKEKSLTKLAKEKDIIIIDNDREQNFIINDDVNIIIEDNVANDPDIIIIILHYRSNIISI